MIPEIKLSISQNDKVIKTMTKETNEQNFVQSLVEFQTAANAMLTNMIEDICDSDGDSTTNDEEDSLSHDEELQQVSPKKKKK